MTDNVAQNEWYYSLEHGQLYRLIETQTLWGEIVWWARILLCGYPLRALIKAELDRGPDFLRLANALSVMYPKGSEEKRLLVTMILAVPR